MKHLILFLPLFISTIKINAQEIKFRESLDKDSLFNSSVQKLPIEKRQEYISTYKDGNEETKDFLLYMISMPVSSKRELIGNFEKKKSDILKLKTEYEKLVPKDFIIDIEFEAESRILTKSEEITIKIYKLEDKTDENKRNTEAVQMTDGYRVISQNWNLKPNSDELKKALEPIGWTSENLKKIKVLLNEANCISIENGKITTIGFARSGMGKYSYKIFEKWLGPNEKKAYNNGCEYIFYKDNIVLEYGGGAIGPQCFEKN